VFVRALIIAPLPRKYWTASGSWNEPEAGSFVHDMF
jgi:hypothetical protein